MAEWQRSGPEPGRDYSDIISARPAARNAFRPATLFEPPHAFRGTSGDPAIDVILLTGRGACLEGHASDFAKFPRP